MSGGEAWRRYTAQMMAGVADAEMQGRQSRRRWPLRSRRGSDDSQDGLGP